MFLTFEILQDFKAHQLGKFKYFTKLLCFFSSLEAVLQEGQKTSNVDIQFMLANVQKCQHIVQQLRDGELDPFYTVRFWCRDQDSR